MFEPKFYQDQSEWRHKLIPSESSKNESEKTVDLLIYKNHFFLIKKKNVVLGNQKFEFFSRRCSNSYTNQDVLINHIQNCGQQEIISKKTRKESHLYWKKHFHKNLLHFGFFADFEVDNEIDNANTGKNIIFKKSCIQGLLYSI